MEASLHANNSSVGTISIMHLNRSESFQSRDIKDVPLVWGSSNSDFHLQWRVNASVLLMLVFSSVLRPLSLSSSLVLSPLCPSVHFILIIDPTWVISSSHPSLSEVLHQP